MNDIKTKKHTFTISWTSWPWEVKVTTHSADLQGFVAVAPYLYNYWISSSLFTNNDVTVLTHEELFLKALEIL